MVTFSTVTNLVSDLGIPWLEVTEVFLDLSKAFDKVWHDGLLYKLRRMGICGEYLRLIDSFLSGRFQRVFLNGQTSKWWQTKAGVPQGSVLGPLLFLVYINDLPEGLNSNAKLFADDTSIYILGGSWLKFFITIS